ncbi:MAG: carbohydrate ABC transporter permease [Thermoanaerobaculia bacterium]|nr:carbohydrate ABC transporter permease [Thermoanaerobaculia bacterium]
MKRPLATLLVNGALALAAAVTAFPLLWSISVSFMATGEASSFPPPLLPREPTLAHYRELFVRLDLGRYLLNSLLLATAVTVVSLLVNGLAGYAFAKLRFGGRDGLFHGLVQALAVPAQVAMLPLFLMLKSMGLVNTWAGLVLPAAASIYGIFLIRQYAQGIPDELLDAARIDGASEARIFFSIVLPLLRPILVTLAIFTFLGTWNDFLWPLIVLSDRDLLTLPVALAGLSREHVQDNELMMAGSVLTVLPVLVLFLALQRHYVQGLLVGSVKG